MPIYQYQCDQCSHQMEALQKMSDAKLVDCPECEAPALRKQVTAAAFKLKGTGWYETDFKNSGAKPATSNKEASTSKEATDSKQAVTSDEVSTSKKAPVSKQALASKE